MKKTLVLLIAFSLIAAISLADTSKTGFENFAPSSINAPGSSFSTYTPVLEISIDHCFNNAGHSMEIASDGSYYYMVNGGSSSYGRMLTYDLDGNLVYDVATNLDGRAVFCYDGEVYVKTYGSGGQLYTVEPSTGATSLVWGGGTFHNDQSHVAFDPSTGYMYEHVEGAVYVIDIATGSTVNTLSGFSYGNWGSNWAIAFNGEHLFTWDGNTVYAYDLDGNFVESFTGLTGSYLWSLDFCNDMMWASDDANYGCGTWYGHSGVEGILCSDVDMVPDDDPVIVPPGGSFGLTGYIGNPNDEPITADVWVGVIYLGDFFQLWNFGNIPLDPGETLSAHLNQYVPGFAPSGTYTYISYSGDKPEACDSATFEFTVTGGRISGGADTWSVSGDWNLNQNTTIPQLSAAEPSKDKPIVAEYTWELCDQISHTMPVTPMTMIWDGDYYYMNNGGIYQQGVIEIYEEDGTFVQQTSTNLDTRGFFFNPNDGLYYIKEYYDAKFHTIDPWTGTSTLIDDYVFNEQQSCLAYVPTTNMMYELGYGTVYEIDLATLQTTNSWSGINGNYAITWNGNHFFTWDGDIVYVYDTDFNLIESHDVEPNGNWYSLGYANDILWTIEYGTAHGFCGFEGGPCCDVDMTPDDDPVIVDPGGRFGLTGYIGNPTDDAIVTDVWGGVIYLGDFFQQFAFNNIPLDPGASMSAHTWQNVPGFAPSGTYTYIAYCGDRPDDICDSASFPFTVTGARIANGATEWSIEGEFFGSTVIPSEYSLDGNFPNPFNASTNISFSLPEAGNVSLEVYNLMGQKVASLMNGYKEAGQHAVNWDASNYSSGVYFYKLSAGEKVFTMRMTLLK
ncbi:MAG: T9SS type A sorting domain-containing protein [candidate division Zixibacteria bacterium]|nr:T9SS type A sorting domain-containing protein [candidate division Zixibacteria bacterium]